TGIDGSATSRSAARSEKDECFTAGSATAALDRATASENDRTSAAGPATTTSARATAARSESDGASAARTAPETASLLQLFPFLVPLLQVRHLFLRRHLEELVHFRIALMVKGPFVDLD